MNRLDKIDRFGHCCLCARNLLTKKVIDGKVQDIWVPEYGEAIFLLNDGSKMQVTICKICQNTHELTDPAVHKDIMDAVMKGWELETKKLTTEGGETPEGNFIRWSKENGEKYLKHMAKKAIDIHVGSIDERILQERSKENFRIFKSKLDEDKKLEVSDVAHK